MIISVIRWAARAHNHRLPGEFLCLCDHVMNLVLPNKNSENLGIPYVCPFLFVRIYACFLSYWTSVSDATLFVLVWHFLIPSEPPAPNISPETTPSSSSGTSEAPCERSPSPSPRTSEKEAQRDRELEVSPEGETEEEKAIRLLYCSLCKVAVNSASQLQAHNSGERLLLPTSPSGLYCV